MEARKGITVALLDGRKLTLDPEPLPADLVAFEEYFGVSSDALTESPSVTKTLFILWRIARREDPALHESSFQEFVDMVKDLVDDEVQPADPPSGQPTG